ncbi:MAG: cytochrome B [Proteobacteria bacterium]|nr:MAG: cytochrome B [Pseudomonadota bacterium]
MNEDKRLVWDLPLRVFHWLFALSLLAAWLTAEGGYDWREVHFYIGYWTLGLLLFRIIWGFVGPRHARFSNFLKGPGEMWRYLRGMLGGDPVHTPGHNPAGGLMVVVMLVLVAIQAITGLFATDDIIWSGPYHPAVSPETAKSLTALHHANFDWILIAVGLHILAIVLYWLVKKQNLVGPMVTGRKPAALVAEHEAIQSSELVKALIVLLVSAAAVYTLINVAPPPPEDFFF